MDPTQLNRNLFFPDVCFWGAYWTRKYMTLYVNVMEFEALSHPRLEICKHLISLTSHSLILWNHLCVMSLNFAFFLWIVRFSYHSKKGSNYAIQKKNSGMWFGFFCCQKKIVYLSSNFIEHMWTNHFLIVNSFSSHSLTNTLCPWFLGLIQNSNIVSFGFGA